MSTVDASQRRESLKELFNQASCCQRCPQLAETRTKVVFGAGNANADLMFIGEAPGANEDRLGLPFVGQAGKLLDKLLAGIELSREDIFIANVLKCRPPGNRDPLPREIENCQEFLFRQLELIQPKLVCTLGNFAMKLLREDNKTGITRLHGKEEIRTIGRRTVRLYPLYHPAAALYAGATMKMLQEDFLRIPGLLAMDAPEQIASGIEDGIADPREDLVQLGATDTNRSVKDSEIIKTQDEVANSAGAEGSSVSDEERTAQLGLF